MASPLSLPTPYFCNRKNVHPGDKARSCSDKIFPSNVNIKEQNYGILPQRYDLYRPFSQKTRLKRIPLGTLSSMVSMADSDQIIPQEEPLLGKGRSRETEFNRVNCLVWVLHESARSFSAAAQTLKLGKSEAELAMAWNGVDVHAWHKNIAYQVAFYALLKAAIEVEVFLSHKRCNNPSVNESLSPIINFLGEQIESQLNMRNPKLVQWFRVVELPRIADFFIPLFKKWSMEYAGSGIAGIIVAITCCAALQKLCSERISCPLFLLKIEDTVLELMNLSDSLVSIDKFHHLATEAGFEEEFLSHFGRKILPSTSIEDVEFWIGLVQKKLINAFHRENAIADKHAFRDKVQENSLATLGLFAYLGRETRLFLSEMAIKDLDGQTMDFLSYLECGSLQTYPEFSTLAQYQLFMEVITDEIGWLDFYAAYASKFCDKRRSKQHASQAETEIILYTVLTVCYDVICGFAHYNNSLQQALEPNLLDFLLHSQSLLSTCLEDFWAAYDRRGELQTIAEKGSSADLLKRSGISSPFSLEGKQASIDLVKREKHQFEPRLQQVSRAAVVDADMVAESSCSSSSSTSEPLHQKLIGKSMAKLITASQLLFIDISDAFGLLVKQLKGHLLTKRERKKMKQTLIDIATLVPVTILMLIPIPSPYSSKRIGVVKQLKITKKMDIKLRNSIEESSSNAVN
nr:uncharacterized protein LOC109187841 isoform X1 [Ipomoea trifida]